MASFFVSFKYKYLSFNINEDILQNSKQFIMHKNKEHKSSDEIKDDVAPVVELNTISELYLNLSLEKINCIKQK